MIRANINAHEDGEWVVITKKGCKVDLLAEPLVVPINNCNRRLHIEQLQEVFGEIFLKKARLYIAYLLPRYSGETVVAFVEGLHRLASASSQADGSEITERLLWSFKNLSERLSHKHPFGKVRQWLLWDLQTSESPLLNSRKAELVQSWKFKNPRPYAAIRQGKDGVGPLSRRDDLRLKVEVRRSGKPVEAAGRLTDYQVRVIIALIRALGVRPTQLSYAKAADLRVWEHDGRRTGFLMIPEVKDGEAPRAHFRKCRLPDDLLKMVEKAIHERPADAYGDWLFPRRYALEDTERNLTKEELWRARSIGGAIASWIKKRDLRDIAGAALKANPRRIRYTFATELAPLMSPVELAHALGHKDERSVVHYFTFGEDFYARLSTIDGATRWGLAAQSFAGLITSERASGADGGPLLFGGDAQFSRTSIVKIGRCGASLQCRLYPPLSCYGCARFRPDPDADHGSVLATLVSWRESRPSTVGKLKDPLQKQLDEVIEAAGYLVAILPAFLWARDELRQGHPRPTVAQISLASGVPVDQVATDRSISDLLRHWPTERRGAGRITARRTRRG